MNETEHCVNPIELKHERWNSWGFDVKCHKSVAKHSENLNYESNMCITKIRNIIGNGNPKIVLDSMQVSSTFFLFYVPDCKDLGQLPTWLECEIYIDQIFFLLHPCH